mmetsp:Transcript_7354/g.27945  ORF Transcript_7354/g.27945 Transcript_7354/m.27945 type:complete len:212 (-) Transcript_7354:875-1510(-)
MCHTSLPPRGCHDCRSPHTMQRPPLSSPRRKRSCRRTAGARQQRPPPHRGHIRCFVREHPRPTYTLQSCPRCVGRPQRPPPLVHRWLEVPSASPELRLRRKGSSGGQRRRDGSRRRLAKIPGHSHRSERRTPLQRPARSPQLLRALLDSCPRQGLIRTWLRSIVADHRRRQGWTQAPRPPWSVCTQIPPPHLLSCSHCAIRHRPTEDLLRS